MPADDRESLSGTAVQDAVESASATFDLFGDFLELRCPNPAIIEALSRRESCWKPLLRSTAATTERAAVVDVLQHPPPSPITRVQHFSNEHFFFHGSRSRLLTGYLYRRPWQVHVQSYLADDETTIDNAILPTLINVLLRLGLVNVHCAAVARDGKALLLIGPSGAGKSTTSYLLARSGFEFLSDNDVYLRRSGDHVDAMSSTNELYLVENTGDRVDGMDFVRDLPVHMRGATAKRVLNMGDVLADRCISRARAAVLVFTRVGNSRDTELRRLDPFSCLDRLMELVPARGLPAAIKDHRAQTTQFETLATLATSVDAYEANLGSSAAGVVEALGSLV